MEFLSIDFETANPDLASICQVGVVSFRDGEAVASWSSLVNPEDWFAEENVAIHGIDESAVRNAPTWPEVFSRLRKLLEGQVVVHHTAFDRTALVRVGVKHSLPAIQCQYLDSARATRRTWPEFSRKGYGLKNVAGHIGVTFKHHDALEDARAAGLVMAHILRKTERPLAEWCSLAMQDLSIAYGAADPPESISTATFMVNSSCSPGAFRSHVPKPPR